MYPGKPVLLPDVTGDGEADLLFPGVLQISDQRKPQPNHSSFMTMLSSSMSTTTNNFKDQDAYEETTSTWFREQNNDLKINEMILVSGSNGKIVGQSLKIKKCHTLTDVSSDGESIDYSCIMASGNSKSNFFNILC